MTPRPPPSLVLGIGCRRGTPADVIARGVGRVLADHGLLLADVSAIATSAHKRGEPGLLAFAHAHELPVSFYAPDELARVPGREPSAAVRAHVGSDGVAEPAALLLAGSDRPLVPKTVIRDESGHSLTVAVARSAAGSGP